MNKKETAKVSPLNLRSESVNESSLELVQTTTVNRGDQDT